MRRRIRQRERGRQRAPGTPRAAAEHHSYHAGINIRLAGPGSASTLPSTRNTSNAPSAICGRRRYADVCVWGPVGPPGTAAAEQVVPSVAVAGSGMVLEGSDRLVDGGEHVA